MQDRLGYTCVLILPAFWIFLRLCLEHMIGHLLQIQHALCHKSTNGLTHLHA